MEGGRYLGALQQYEVQDRRDCHQRRHCFFNAAVLDHAAGGVECDRVERHFAEVIGRG